MKFFPLVWSGLWRKRVRTTLTILSIVVAFALFGIMQGFTTALDDAIEGLTDEARLIVQSRVNITEPLPLAFLPRIASIEGIRDVSPYGFFGGYYQEPTRGVNVGAVDLEKWFTLLPEFEVEPDQLQTALRTRTGAVVGADLMEEFGWSVGERIPLGSSIWTNNTTGTTTWEVDIVATYDVDGGIPADDFYIHYDYFDEARSGGNGTVSLYFLRVNDVSRSDELAAQIDAMFANSTNETQTQNETEFTRGQISQIGDINFFVNAIAGAVLFTLLFLTGNTMMQSVRERIPEFAVLKTYGFSNTSVTSFIYAESFLLCLGAALLGLAIATTSFPLVFEAMGVLRMPLPWSVVGYGCLMAAIMAIASALPPAFRAQRSNIVDALAGR